jgi:hypothetical protein
MIDFIQFVMIVFTLWVLGSDIIDLSNRVEKLEKKAGEKDPK